MHGARHPAEAGFRAIGAHTDSPALRLKPRPGIAPKGYLQPGEERPKVMATNGFLPERSARQATGTGGEALRPEAHN